MGKKKDKKKQSTDNKSPSDVDNASMGEDDATTKMQSKKGKRRDDNWEDDVLNEFEIISEDKVSEENNAPAEATTKPKTKKGKKKVEENWEDDVLNELEIIAGDKVSEENNAPAEATTKPKTKKGRKKVEENWEDEVLNEIATLADDKPAEDATAAEESGGKSKKKKPKKKTEQHASSKDAVSTNDASGNHKTDTGERKEDEDTTKATSASTEDADQNQPTLSNKQKKKKKAEEEKAKKEDKAKKSKPNKAALKFMKVALQKQKEEEERVRKEEEERIRREEEEHQKKLEAAEKERLKKEKKKQDKKDRIEQLKKEGKYLNPTQRAAQRRREAYLETLKQAGLDIPAKSETTDKPRKPIYERKKKQSNKEKSEESEVVKDLEEEVNINQEEPTPASPEPPKTSKVGIEREHDQLDDWENMIEDTPKEGKSPLGAAKKQNENDFPESEDSSSEDESDEDEGEEELTQREKAQKRIYQLQEQNELNRSTDNLRSPVICVMGHVDTGKTKILDKIRHSHVQDGEAGGITQQIGATNIPVTEIKNQTQMVQNFNDILIPGLLVIDTPGHESFKNLRSRGSSNCDMAILVVDIMHGLEPQTIESIDMLKKKKTPFIVALNKIDRLYEWKSSPNTDIVATIERQKRFTKDEFESKTNHVIAQFAEQNLNAKLSYENDDPDTWISMVPTSAHSGDGMGNLIALVVQSCQTRLARRLAFSENLQCTVLEVKAIHGLGTTVDVILTNGRLKYGDTIVIAGVEGPIVTHVKALLMPQPLKELRVKNPYDKFNEIKAAQGVKVLAKDLDKALAGTSLLVAKNEDEIGILRDEVQAEVTAALKSIKLQERGVYVQASTLGSLEALLEFLKQSKIPYSGISIGPVHKRDVTKASVMLEHDDQWAVILAFDVKVEREAQEMAEGLGVKIFTADIIYHLFDAFMRHREDLKRQKQDENRHLAVFPCKIKIVPNCVFKTRDPIVIGVTVEAGQLRVGTPICVPGKDFLNVGIVASMEFNHKPVEVARKPQEICIKIEGTPGEAPKMVGRHFDENDVLTSKITRESIDLLKNWFRDDMQKNDWQLIIELKKLFEII